MRLPTSLLAAASLLALTVSAQVSASPETYYAGKTIRIMIPFSPGGGTDTFGRYIAQFLGKHVPGNPTVIAENVTGAGGLMGSNEFAERVEHDGLTLLTASGHLNLRAFIKLEGLRLNLNELSPVVAAPMGHVTAISTNYGISSPEEIVEARGRLTKGITDPVGLLESLLALELFDLDYRAIPGYSGRGDTRIAFERGELAVTTQSTPAYLAQVVPLVEEGSAMPLYAIGFIDADGNPVRDPAVPDMITAPELYQQIHGELPSGPAWEAFKAAVPLVQNTRGTIWVHRDAPADAKEALRIGVERMAQDPEFLAAGETMMGGYQIITGSGLDQIGEALDGTSPEVIEWIQTMLNERFGVNFDS